MVQTILQYDQQWPNLCEMQAKRKDFFVSLNLLKGWVLLLEMLAAGKIILNKNTWGANKCGANQKQHCK